MVATLVLGTSAERRGGSSPSIRTKCSPLHTEYNVISSMQSTDPDFGFSVDK